MGRVITRREMDAKICKWVVRGGLAAIFALGAAAVVISVRHNNKPVAEEQGPKVPFCIADNGAVQTPLPDGSCAQGFELF